MIDCQIGEDFRCVRCGRQLKSKAIRRNCGPHSATTIAGPAELHERFLGFSQSRGLGDMVADGLSAFGITQERTQAVASAVGIADCGCAQRQAKLNDIGREWLGVGLDAPATLTGEREADATQAATAEGQAAEPG